MSTTRVVVTIWQMSAAADESFVAAWLGVVLPALTRKAASGAVPIVIVCDGTSVMILAVLAKKAALGVVLAVLAQE